MRSNPVRRKLRFLLQLNLWPVLAKSLVAALRICDKNNKSSVPHVIEKAQIRGQENVKKVNLHKN
ncbi:hypothetical protein RP20_CCG016052 [Aedes albopictus]|nr:hypothetical protein RP20_CCG016052 [Aedes albopictus]